MVGRAQRVPPLEGDGGTRCARPILRLRIALPYGSRLFFRVVHNLSHLAAPAKEVVGGTDRCNQDCAQSVDQREDEAVLCCTRYFFRVLRSMENGLRVEENNT